MLKRVVYVWKQKYFFLNYHEKEYILNLQVIYYNIILRIPQSKHFRATIIKFFKSFGKVLYISWGKSNCWSFDKVRVIPQYCLSSGLEIFPSIHKKEKRNCYVMLFNFKHLYKQFIKNALNKIKISLFVLVQFYLLSFTYFTCNFLLYFLIYFSLNHN